ncbi:SRPBCC domain-containing protein [Pseudonocardia sp. N23]|uniref:SRPBCC domain-containing protein n=1 Tax=Pseudonocardia sp. N23 TaxID=1987376 RepID=UPI000BFD3075|nr:SRPBCC domain-containing protein [Pseudonocardia sp. N23]
MHSTRVSLLVRAPRSVVWRALVDAGAVARWRVPDGMTAEVHEFDAREGGRFRISLTYTDPAAGSGKTDAHTDTYHGVFTTLRPEETLVEALEFESDDPAARGTLTQTTTLADAGGGTEVTIAHDGIPDAVSPADNEIGTRMALANLATLVEGSYQ